MWRLTRTQWFVLGCAIAALLLVGFARSAPATPADASCPVGHFGNLTAATCSFPSGGTMTVPCGVNWQGLVWCTINLPDVNPADWAGYVGCTVTSGLLTAGSLIWNAVAGVFQYIVSAITNALNTAVSLVINAIMDAILGVINGIGQALISVENAVDSAALGTGPLAPVIITVLWLTIGIVAAVALYFAILGMIAFGKTLFNLA